VIGRFVLYPRKRAASVIETSLSEDDEFIEAAMFVSIMKLIVNLLEVENQTGVRKRK